MADYVALLNVIKKASQDVIGEGVPSGVEIGLVVAVNPLEIELENKLALPADFFLLTKNTCEWSVDMTVDHNTELAAGGSGDAQYESHKHGYKGRKTYLVHNGLAVGDKVILLREQGGQRYVVLDKVYNPERGCSD